MTASQQRRVDILTRLGTGALGMAEAAELLGVSPRQMRRMRQRFTPGGMSTVQYCNQRRTPTNRTDPKTVERIVALVGDGGKYHARNVCHLQDLLAQHEQIAIGRSTLDRLLKQEGLRQSRRDRPPVHRRRRERQGAEEMLVQIDASSHRSSPILSRS